MATGNVMALAQPEPKRRPGRPRTIRRPPDEAEREQHRRVAERLQRHVDADPVVLVARRAADRTSTEALDAAMMALAREAAALGWDRLQAQTQGRRDAERISSRRVDALSRLASLVGERARVGLRDDLDPFDPRLQRLVVVFADQVREVTEETLGTETAARFIQGFERRMNGWEDRV